MRAVVAAFNQEKALVGAFSVIVQPVVEPMEHYTALILPLTSISSSSQFSGAPLVAMATVGLLRGGVGE